MPPTSRYFNLDHAAAANVALIELTLDADLDIEAFNEITAELIDRWPVAAGRHVVVDLSRSQYLGSVLLGLLINIRQRTRAGRGAMVIASAPTRLLQAMRTANLDRILPVAATRSQALAAF